MRTHSSTPHARSSDGSPAHRSASSPRRQPNRRTRGLLRTWAAAALLGALGLGACGGEGDGGPDGGGNSGGTAGPDGGNPDSGTGTGGGLPGTGGTGPVGACGRTVGACSAPEVRVTEIDVGVPVTQYGNEWDTAPLPMALAALPNGGSRVAWLGTDEQVHIAELDCDDQLVGEPFAFPATDLQDLYADEDGGVVLLTRPADGSGEDGCGAGPLCGGESSPCYNMFLVRFDNAGNKVWERAVTNAVDGLEGYENGARFVWWYQHHGRIAFDGENYGTYFCIGITVQNGSCVDI
ncbi:MAG TPA: hypothetical protein VLC09_10650, partial [Polyangiaceae bacterium]|nr:hypothetical protein [Polyangiaceae bacterium]